MANRSHASRSPQYALLGFLYAGPSHGYDLHQRLVSELGQVWHVSQSQTYNILKRLEAQGEISSKTIIQTKLPPRQLLSITAAGRRHFKAWLDAPTGSSVRAIRLEFITRLYFVRKFAPERTPQILDEEAAEINATLDRLDANRASVPPEQIFNHLSLSLRIQQLRSVLTWLDECRREFLEA